MAIIDNRWHPGIGDPTLAGWITVLVYAATAWLAYRAAKQASAQGRPMRGTLWALFAITLALGINKQLDLQSWFTEVMRDLAKTQGWYAERQRYQLAFIIGLATLGLIAWLTTLRLAVFDWTRGMTWIASGMALILVFVLMRASSFHHIDAFLGLQYWRVRWNHVLENGALLILCRGFWIEGWRAPPALLQNP